jgi:hypothetical protein
VRADHLAVRGCPEAGVHDQLSWGETFLAQCPQLVVVCSKRYIFWGQSFWPIAYGFYTVTTQFPCLSGFDHWSNGIPPFWNHRNWLVLVAVIQLWANFSAELYHHVSGLVWRFHVISFVSIAILSIELYDDVGNCRICTPRTHSHKVNPLGCRKPPF